MAAEQGPGALGEFGLIRRLLDGVPHAGDGVLLGPGDDAALLELGGVRVLATADLLVEGRHFDLAFSTPQDAGTKAIAVNASDIAAMGGRPRFALLSLGVPAATSLRVLDGLRDGLAEGARTYGVLVVGGDVVRTDVLTVSVAMLGDPGARVVERGGARPGDVVCVTGSVGGAAAGLALLRAASADPVAAALLEANPALVEMHRRGRARIEAGASAAASGVTAMIDVSDGLAQDLGHICAASGVGVELRAAAIPLAAGVDDVAAWEGRPGWSIGLGGGDDYELAMCVAEAGVDALRAALAPLPLTVIGTVIDDESTLVLPDGVRMPLPAAGWDHFGEGA